MSKLSQKESNSIRLHRLVATVFGVDYGSLWWVPDQFWLREIPTFKSRPGGKHPGLCIGTTNSASVFDPWPLLLGVSKSGPLPVTGMNANDPDKVGYFGRVLRPAMFEAKDFTTYAGDDRNQSISRNRFKPTLSDNEESELRSFLRKKGLLTEP
ncbi:MAG: hypothetical protein H7A51_19410 [Akkermansiaceae bacterium]|nr:hypothetical protein [Akkermansiaceae bacterium]